MVGSRDIHTDVAEGLSAFDTEFGARIQQRDAGRTTVRLLDKELQASASGAAVQAKIVAETTRQLRSALDEQSKRTAAVKLVAASARAAEHQHQVSLAADRAAAAEALSTLQAELELARRTDRQRCHELKEQLAQERRVCEQAQKELRASILQTKKALLAQQGQAEERAAAAARHNGNLLTQLQSDAREIGEQRARQQRLVQENGERKQANEGRLKAIVSSHPNSQENLWREKLRLKSEQLARLKQLLAAR